MYDVCVHTWYQVPLPPTYGCSCRSDGKYRVLRCILVVYTHPWHACTSLMYIMTMALFIFNYTHLHQPPLLFSLMLLYYFAILRLTAWYKKKKKKNLMKPRTLLVLYKLRCIKWKEDAFYFCNYISSETNSFREMMLRKKKRQSHLHRIVSRKWRSFRDADCETVCSHPWTLPFPVSFLCFCTSPYTYFHRVLYYGTWLTRTLPLNNFVLDLSSP